LWRKPNIPEVVALAKYFDSIKVAFGTNASLPHYAADRFLSAADSLEANLLPLVQRSLQKQTATAAADVHSLDNLAEVFAPDIG